ncbi:hypothetical protein AWB74_08456 [Caballeronia arvi]|uniref:HTH cro/C1-type domain-containing protein n=1 Tax=Caballeronia arvi TaxID=1777135 RepID=A0A158L4L7_9BURK|nr:helix-turn-helix transcriptional regulator [Caballeronia arvi]SAL88215.1 hypothetical protein AWB74_08456 [Caballeronia arvi]
MNDARKKFFGSFKKESRKDLRRFGVAAQFKAAMMGAGVSQQDLADRLHKDKGQISRQLSGSANMTVDTMYEFADALGAELHIVVGDIKRESWADSFLSLDFGGGAHLVNNVKSVRSSVGRDGFDVDFGRDAINEHTMDAGALMSVAA